MSDRNGNIGSINHKGGACKFSAVRPQLQQVLINVLGHIYFSVDYSSWAPKSGPFIICTRIVDGRATLAALLPELAKLRNTLKGISRGPEALQSHLNDFYHTSVLCWP